MRCGNHWCGVYRPDGGSYTGQSREICSGFEKEWPGEGAPSRNGGITSGGLRIDLGGAIRKFGKSRGIGLHREATFARRFLKNLIRENDIACDYALPSLFTGAITQADLSEQKRQAEFANKTPATDIQIIEKPQLSSFIGSDCYVGGVLNPEVGTIHPAKLVAGLLEAAQYHGAVVHGQTAVTGLKRTRSEFSIQTTRGTCRARNVIVATNGYTDASNPWLRRRVFPVVSRIVVTEELPSNLTASLTPDRRAMAEVRKLYCYYRPTPDGRRILLGGREPAWGHGRSTAIKHVRSGLTWIFPDLGDVKLSHSWSGNVASAVPSCL